MRAARRERTRYRRTIAIRLSPPPEPTGATALDHSHEPDELATWDALCRLEQMLRERRG